jgi:hypothetical protein
LGERVEAIGRSASWAEIIQNTDLEQIELGERAIGQRFSNVQFRSREEE